MTDTMTPEQRHRCMSRIRGKDTKPEMIVRRWLWSHGYRYRLHSRKLAGRPDIVIHRLKTVIFINGCFWHGHNTGRLAGGEIADSTCCRIPASNRQFWLDKINRNMDRDTANRASLTAAGWRVLTVWECDLRPARRQATLDALLEALRQAESPTPIRAAYGYDEETPAALAAEPPAAYGKE